MATYAPVTSFQTTLDAPMSPSVMTALFTSVETEDGHFLTNSDVGFFYFIIDPGLDTQEICLTTTTPISGTAPATINIATRGLLTYGSTDGASAARQFNHNSGATVIITNAKNVYKQLVDKTSDETVNGIKSFTSSPNVPDVPPLGTSAVNKDYVATVMANGFPNLLVSPHGAHPTTHFDVNSGEYVSGSASGYFVGATNQALALNTVSYIQLRYDGTLIVDSQFNDGYIPLAVATTNGTDITVLVDSRPFTAGGVVSELIYAYETYGATLTFGDPVRIDAGTGKVIKALATTAGNADGFYGIAIESGVDTNFPKRVMVGGVFGFAAGLTTNAPVYLSDTGTLVNTPGTYKKMIGWALSPTEFVLIRTSTVDLTSGSDTNVTTANLNGAMDFENGVIGDANWSSTNAKALVDGGTLDTLHFHAKTYGATAVYSNGTTTTTIAHGLGVTPNRIRIIGTSMRTGSYVATSYGEYDGAIYACVYSGTDLNASPINYASTGVICGFQQHQTSAYTATVTTLNSTNIILTWSGALDNPTYNLLWEAEV